MHTHPLPEELHQGCPACIARVRADQLAAEVAAAPIRRVTWTCIYATPGDPGQVVTFTKDLRVPAGWDGWRVDEHYGHLTGEWFVLALPSSVELEDTGYACETMEVASVSIGAIIPDPAPAPAVDQPDLFGGWAS